jgi:phosphatidylinositol glycan class W
MFVGGFYAVDYYFVRDQTETFFFKTVNRNQLVIFLIANLMTGGINMSIDTLSVDDFSAIGIITMYSFIVGLISVILHELNITIKL